MNSTRREESPIELRVETVSTWEEEIPSEARSRREPISGDVIIRLTPLRISAWTMGITGSGVRR